MQALELKIPPPVVALLTAAAMWRLAILGGRYLLPPTVHTWAAILPATAGLGIAFAGAAEFRRARTTVNPMKPQAATAMVTGGVFGHTRNPMYLGLLLVLCGWALHLCSAWAWAGPPAFALYITRFQIVPEERALKALFGAAFADYAARVRRWL